jgi:hypothetical protein
MKETLYKTKVPQAIAGHKQFFELALGEQKVQGETGYFVRETHCWWDAKLSRTVRVQYTRSPREGFKTVDDARACYESHKMNRARCGFVHSFAPHYDAAKKHRYVLIKIAPDVKKEVEKEEPEKPAETA